MAIRPEDEYGSRAVPASADYPEGSAQDETVDGANDGTPYTARWRNDVWGFLQGLLSRAGITPSGNPDTTQDSDYLDALEVLLLRSGGLKYAAATEEGNALNLGTTNNIRGTALSSNAVALADTTNDTLRKYEFDGADWAQVGNAFALGGLSTQLVIAALSSNAVALIDTDFATLRKYEFDGTDWAQVGNAFALPRPPSNRVGMTALSGDTVAAVVGEGDSLRTYQFDGTDWAQVGNAFSAPATTATVYMTGLTGSMVAMSDAINQEITAYEFDGTDWAQVGNAFSVGSGGAFLAAVSSTDVAALTVGDDTIQFYRFDGTDWRVYGDPATVAVDVASGDLCALGPGRLTGLLTPLAGGTLLTAYEAGGVSTDAPYSPAGGAF